MKQLNLMWILALAAAPVFAQNSSIVRWNQMVGVITRPGMDNPVGGTSDSHGNKVDQIHSITGPWTTRGGAARLDLATGEGSFEVEGLVLNSGSAMGTPGPINSVVGTLVCNPGTATQSIIDTTAVELSSKGDAAESFKLSLPRACGTALFLIRAPQAGLRWLAIAAIARAES